MKERILADCGSCGGTGLYQGYAQEDGYPTVCTSCKGTGAKEITFTRHTGRRLKDGVRGVRPEQNAAFGGRRPSSYDTITYDEFRTRYPEMR